MPNLLLKSAGILLVAALVAFAGLLFSMPELSAQETDSDGEPAATPTPVPPTATPTPRPNPTVALSSRWANWGSVITVRGEHFDPSVPLKVRIRSRERSISGPRSWEITPSPAPHTDNRGSFEFEITLSHTGTAGVGSHEIVVVGMAAGGIRSGRARVSIKVPSLSLSTTSGTAGSVIAVSGRDFYPGSFTPGSFTVTVGGDDVTPSPIPSIDHRGRTEFDIQIPWFAPGDYYVLVKRSERRHNRLGYFTVVDPPTPTPTPAPTATPMPTPMPTPTLYLSPGSGAPGSRITLRGEGFSPYVPVVGVWVNGSDVFGIDILPSPAPATNAQGITEFDIIVPGVDAGRYFISAQAGGNSVNVEFTVISASAPPSTPRPTSTPYATPAPTAAPPQLQGGSGVPPHIFIGTANLNGSPAGQGVAIDAYDGGRLIGATVTQAGGRFSIHTHRAEGVITFRVNNQAAAESWPAWRQGQVTTGFNLTAAGNSGNETDPGRLFAALPALVRAFSFDNTTKSWFFFDPAAAEVSTLTRFIPQQAYWLLVSHTTRLLLNGVERNLSCVTDDCWNIIVW